MPPNIGKNQFNFRLINRKAYPSKQSEAEAGCPEKVVTIPTGTQYTSNASLEIFRGCTKIIGDLRIGGSFQPTFSIFDCLEEITGNLFINNNATLTSISGFGALGSVGSVFSINNNATLTSITGFAALESVGSVFSIYGNATLTEISGFAALESVVGNFSIYGNATLTSITGFGALENVGGFSIYTNAKLTEITGFGALGSVGSFSIYTGSFSIYTNAKLTSISGFAALGSVGGGFFIQNNGFNVSADTNNVVTTVTGFGNLSTVPQGITGDLRLDGVSVTQLLEIASAIVANLTAATSGTVTKINLYTA